MAQLGDPDPANAAVPFGPDPGGASVTTRPRRPPWRGSTRCSRSGGVITCPPLKATVPANWPPPHSGGTRPASAAPTVPRDPRGRDAMHSSISGAFHVRPSPDWAGLADAGRSPAGQFIHRTVRRPSSRMPDPADLPLSASTRLWRGARKVELCVC
jgi:hypothetical protein